MLKNILKPKSEKEILNDISQLENPVDRFCYGFKFHYEKINNKTFSFSSIQTIIKTLDARYLNYTIQKEVQNHIMETTGFYERTSDFCINVNLDDYYKENIFKEHNSLIEYDKIIIISMNKVFIL